MSEQHAQAALEEVVAGNARAVAPLRDIPPAVIQKAAERISLIIKPDAVTNVLTQLRSNDIQPETAQRWGSLVMHGYLEDVEWPGHEHLFFEYDARFELSIAEAVLRLEGIGDLIDGEVTAAECAQLIDSLSRPDQPDREG